MYSQSNNFWRSIPPVTKNLIIINLCIFLVQSLFPRFGVILDNKLGLHLIGASMFNPVQPITYMFLHGGFLHVFFNMFTLWMFGRILEQVWGSRRYFVYYMICGIGAALVQEGVWALGWNGHLLDIVGRAYGVTHEHAAQLIEQWQLTGNTEMLSQIEALKNQMLTVGASGAIYGLLLGFAMTFPDMPLYLFFIPVPIKAKYMVIGYAVIEFFLGWQASDSVAHFAHLGGMAFGIILLLYWRHNHTLRR